MYSRPSRRSRWIRPGLGLVDLLITISIVGLLIMTLLPVLQVARRSARGELCAVNLRNLSLAVLRFEGATGTLPPGGYVTHRNPASWCSLSFSAEFNCLPISNGSYSTEVPMLSWIALCLPYMGQQTLFDMFDLERGIREQSQLAVGTVLPELICPASPDTAVMVYDGSGGLSPLNNAGLRFAKGNYGAYVSPVHVDHLFVHPGALGGFQRGSRFGQTMQRVTDGVGRTILATDIKAIPRDWDSRAAWILPFPGVLLGLDLHPLNNNLSLTRYIPDPSPTLVDAASTPNAVIYGESDLGDATFVCAEEAWLRQVMRAPCFRIHVYMAAAPRSNHHGGVFAVTLDGRTTFLTDKVDPILMSYLVSINDGQNVQLP